eukprot:gene27636-37741_t
MPPLLPIADGQPAPAGWGDTPAPGAPPLLVVIPMGEVLLGRAAVRRGGRGDNGRRGAAVPVTWALPGPPGGPPPGTTTVIRVVRAGGGPGTCV